MGPRAAKSNAMKAIQSSQAYDDEEHLMVEEEDSNVDIPVHIVDVIDNPDKGKTFTVPVVSQNAPNGFSLDMFKQYKRRVDFCNRDVVRIHYKSLNKKDHGSGDKGLIYVDFQAGMFEAVKVNLMKCLKRDFDIKLIDDPKVEYYGGAEERICLDLRMNVDGNTHDFKVKVYNTKCRPNVA